MTTNGHPQADGEAILPGLNRGPVQPFDEAIGRFDRASLVAKVAQAERERLEIVTRFPLGDWPSMPLERYALGTPNYADSFCRWMEFATPNIASIKGGSALKHMIYRKSSDGTWYFEKKYASVEEAWQSVRAGFVEAFRLAAEGRFDEIGDLRSINAAISLSTKAIFCYYPNDLLPVCSGAHQDHFWKLLGGTGPIVHGVPGARRLLELVRERSGLESWSPQEIEAFLYLWADPRQGRRIVKIAPGPNAELWINCLENGYIRVGWDEVGDLGEFENRELFSARFADTYMALYKGNAAKTSEKAGEVWTLTELVPGDIVVANRGTSHVVGIGRVNDRRYEWKPGLGDYAHTVGVDWEPGQERDIDPIKRWAFKTVAPVSQAEYLQILKGRTLAGDSAPRIRRDSTGIVDPLLSEIAAEIERKGQVILYGPPGTGKTYNARRFAVWWLADRLKQPNAAALLDSLTDLRTAEEALSHGSSDRRVSRLPDLGDEEADAVGHVTRVTFHPSYTYEDFVEGFKPQPTGAGSIELAMEDGVFKRVCAAARLKPDEPFLLLIDEINRGNIPKIFGELITLLERDKRGLTVTLPQSRETFEVPANVYVLGTMNTADRSIRLLDAALRRRFAFIELMPDTSLLSGASVGGLDLALFLETLNDRIAKTEGREKQIGHSFLLDDTGHPIADVEQFAAQFRHEIVPLLQEYAFEDYSELESYLGRTVVDVDAQRIRAGVLDDAQALLDALTLSFRVAVTEADVEPA